MEEDEINYRSLREIQQLEKNSPVLTELKSYFYTDLSKYLNELEKRLKNESSLQKKTLLKDEIENTKKIAIHIYELREKKILFAAITKTRGGNPDIKNMLNIEKNLFDSLINVLKTTRIQLFKQEPTEKNTIDSEEKAVETKKLEEKQKNSNPIVRVIEDVPEFIGTNEKRYYLRKNDVLSLPDDMCEMLYRRGVIKKINN